MTIIWANEAAANIIRSLGLDPLHTVEADIRIDDDYIKTVRVTTDEGKSYEFTIRD